VKLSLATKKIKSRPVGRPPNGKILVGFKLTPEIVNTLRSQARKTGRQNSELVELALRDWFRKE
jgi:hypothetical protein